MKNSASTNSNNLNNNLKPNYMFTIETRNGKDHLLDYKGDEIFAADEIKPNMLTLTPFIFRNGDKYGMVCGHGDVILDPVYDSIRPDANGFTFLTRDGKEGFIANGHLIEPIYDKIEVDADDNILVTLNGVEGYIDENDTFTTDPDLALYSMSMFL